MIELETGADKYVLRDRDVEISFHFVGDRWQHSVSVCRDQGWLTVLSSAEGGPADQVLPSPAFQELRCEQLAEGICEFQLFGRSGKGVYSAAMRYDAGDRSLDFDLCARGSLTDSLLCTVCTYRLAGREDLEKVLVGRSEKSRSNCHSPLTPGPSPARGEGSREGTSPSLLPGTRHFASDHSSEGEVDSAILVPAGFSPIRIGTVAIAASPASECRLSETTGERRLAVGCFEVAGAMVAGKPSSVRWRLRMMFASVVAAFA